MKHGCYLTSTHVYIRTHLDSLQPNKENYTEYYIGYLRYSTFTENLLTLLAMD